MSRSVFMRHWRALYLAGFVGSRLREQRQGDPHPVRCDESASRGYRGPHAIRQGGPARRGLTGNDLKRASKGGQNDREVSHSGGTF